MSGFYLRVYGNPEEKGKYTRLYELVQALA